MQLNLAMTSMAHCRAHSGRRCGGCTTLDGVRKDDALSNTRGGLTVALPVNRKWSVKLNVSTGINARTGTSFDTIGVAGQFRWGAGL
jgi:hypothetical protein